MTLVEVNGGLLENAQKNIKKSLERVAKKQFKDNDAGQKKFVDEVSQRISGSVDIKSTIKTTDLVIEAIIENIKIKHELFSSIDSVREFVQSNKSNNFPNKMFLLAGTSSHHLCIEYVVTFHF